MFPAGVPSPCHWLPSVHPQILFHVKGYSSVCWSSTACWLMAVSASFFPGCICTGPGLHWKEGWGLWSTRWFTPESLREEEKTSDHSGHASERVCVYLWEWQEAEGVDGCLEWSHHPALMSTGRSRQAATFHPGAAPGHTGTGSFSTEWVQWFLR